MTTLSPQAQAWLTEHQFSTDNWQQVDEHGNNALSKAILREEFAIAKELLNIKELDLNQRNNDGNNALWFACFKDDIELIQSLVKAGINIDNQNAVGVTCLMYAASTGKIEVVNTLLALNADVHLTNQDDFKALDFAASFEVLKILKAVT